MKVIAIIVFLLFLYILTIKQNHIIPEEKFEISNHNSISTKDNLPVKNNCAETELIPLFATINPIDPFIYRTNNTAENSRNEDSSHGNKGISYLKDEELIFYVKKISNSENTIERDFNFSLLHDAVIRGEIKNKGTLFGEEVTAFDLFLSLGASTNNLESLASFGILPSRYTYKVLSGKNVNSNVSLYDLENIASVPSNENLSKTTPVGMNYLTYALKNRNQEAIFYWSSYGLEPEIAFLTKNEINYLMDLIGETETSNTNVLFEESLSENSKPEIESVKNTEGIDVFLDKHPFIQFYPVNICKNSTKYKIIGVSNLEPSNLYKNQALFGLSLELHLLDIEGLSVENFDTVSADIFNKYSSLDEYLGEENPDINLRVEYSNNTLPFLEYALLTQSPLENIISMIEYGFSLNADELFRLYSKFGLENDIFVEVLHSHLNKVKIFERLAMLSAVNNRVALFNYLSKYQPFSDRLLDTVAAMIFRSNEYEAYYPIYESVIQMGWEANHEQLSDLKFLCEEYNISCQFHNKLRY